MAVQGPPQNFTVLGKPRLFWVEEVELRYQFGKSGRSLSFRTSWAARREQDGNSWTCCFWLGTLFDYLRTFRLLVGPELGDRGSLTYPGIFWRGFLGLSGRKAKDSWDQAREFGRNPFSRTTRGYSA